MATATSTWRHVAAGSTRCSLQLPHHVAQPRHLRLRRDAPRALLLQLPACALQLCVHEDHLACNAHVGHGGRLPV